MAEHTIDRVELGKVLGLEIPENATFEFSISTPEGELSDSDLEEVAGGVALATPVFQAQVGFQNGAMVSRNRVGNINPKLDIGGMLWPR